MPTTPSTPPKTVCLEIGGKTHIATYDVQDGCVQVTYKGRRSTWTEIGDARAADVARMILRELLLALVVAICINGGSADPAGARKRTPQPHATQSAPQPQNAGPARHTL
jgi:hypothetical protein